MKIVYNACYGGFGLSEKALRRYAEIKGLTLYPERTRFGFTTYWTVPPEQRPAELEGKAWHRASMDERKAHNAAYSAAHIYDRDIPRDDPALVQVVEELGSKEASGQFARLEIAELPLGTHYRIDEYDGSEHVETRDEIPWLVAT